MCKRGIVKALRIGHAFVMRPWIALAFVCFAQACLPLNTYYAEGVRFADLERDNTACDVIALRDAPVANVVRQGPPQYIRRRHCDSSGNCHVSGGYWVPGDIYTVDVNAGLRARVKGQCMADRGYRPVELPACPPGVADAAPEGISTVLPRLTPQSCAIRREGGGFRVVNQG